MFMKVDRIPFEAFVGWDAAGNPIYPGNPRIPSGLEPESGPLQLYNWAEYVNEAVLKSFEKKYGVEVQLSTFSTLDEAVAKLAAGAVGYDVFVPTQPYFWGTYSFSPNKSAGKDLVEFLMQRDNIEARDVACEGYDLPPYAKLTDFKVWEEVAPPKGTVYNYPLRPASGQKPSLTGFEAPPQVAVQIYNRAIHNQMMARIKEGQTIPQVIAWAQDELEGFAR